VRVGEYYRIPPQHDRHWEVELYDESRDTWFKLSPDDLDKYADLSGQGGTGNNFVRQVDTVHWGQFTNGLAFIDGAFALKMTADPTATQTTVTMPGYLKPRDNLNWDATYRHIQTMHQGAFDKMHTKDDFHTIAQEINRGGLFVPQPNHTNYAWDAFPVETRNIAFWLFMNAAFLTTTCHLLWTQVTNMDRAIVREKIIPFVYGANHQAVLAEYDLIPDDARMNIYHSLMFLGCPMRFHPDDTVRAMLEKKFAERGVSIHTLRATLTHFVRRCLDNANEPIPDNRIKLGKRLDDAFRVGRFSQSDASRCVFNKWPPTPPGLRPIAVAAGVAENVGSLDDYRIEEYYTHHHAEYEWNTMPPIQEGHEDTVHEGTTLDSFLYAAMLRMMTSPDDERTIPEFWPVLKTPGSNESVEYVIIRPVIEHNMLGVIMGRGGSEELGNTLWGQTELSCYDDSFHGVWGMS
jgi:hypothetical protein